MAEGSDAHADIASLSFEAALAELNEVVDRLEGGEVALDESIRLYERGEALRQHCEKALDAAELKVEKIVAGRDGAARTAAFDGG
ncbi:MAG: exodeoxyribonuclease VII small subunit [Pseudomonadota bacterium]